MKRKAIEELIQWKEINNRTPILLTGAKGVGKTYLAYDFAKAFFERIFYINFEQESILNELFSSDPTEKTIERLKQHFQINVDETSSTGILILDEISFCEEVMKSIIKTEIKDLFSYIIIITSRPLSDKCPEGIRTLSIYPLEFDEFLIATGNMWYIDLIETHYNNSRKLPDIVHKELLDLHQLYLKIGGMPSSVNEYQNLSSTVNVSELHRILIGSIHDGIVREYEESDSLKMLQVMNSVSRQLMKDNKKFQYKLIRKGTTYSMYKESIQRLIDKNYLIKCKRIGNELLLDSTKIIEYISLSSDDTNVAFKLYLLDTGLLHTELWEDKDTLSSEQISKALLENYMAQSLLAKQYPFVFWESESIAKIDFVIYKENMLLPVELHTDCNTRSKSLSVLKQKYDYPYAIKVSAKNFEFTNNIKYIPYYAVFCI